MKETKCHSCESGECLGKDCVYYGKEQMRLSDFTKKEQEIILAYNESLQHISSARTRIAYAKRLLKISEPNVLILSDRETWYDILDKNGMILHSIPLARSRYNAIYNIGEFLDFLKNVSAAGQHIDDWFNPNCHYEKVSV